MSPSSSSMPAALARSDSIDRPRAAPAHDWWPSRTSTAWRSLARERCTRRLGHGGRRGARCGRRGARCGRRGARCGRHVALPDRSAVPRPFRGVDRQRDDADRDLPGLGRRHRLAALDGARLRARLVHAARPVLACSGGPPRRAPADQDVRERVRRHARLSGTAASPLGATATSATPRGSCWPAWRSIGL